MCPPGVVAAIGIGGQTATTKKGLIDPLSPVNAPKFGMPKLIDDETTKGKAMASAEAQKLKALAAYGLSDTKKTGGKGLGSTPAANKLYASLLGG